MRDGPETAADLLPPPAGRIALVLLTGIGDVVHGLPLVNALKDHRPDLEITWVAEPAPAEVVRVHPAVERVVAFRKSRGIRGIAGLYRDLRSDGSFGLALNLQRHFKGIPPTLLSGAPIRVGLARDKTRDGVSLVNTHHLPSGPWKHTQDIFLDFLPLLGLPRPERPVWDITFSDEEAAAARRYFADAPPGPRVGLVVGTAVPDKDWPEDRYTGLVDALHAEYGWQIFLLGGPAESDQRVAGRTVERARSKPVWALTDSVRELMWRIRGMDLVISPDTGPLHLARAMDVPVIGLYGFTNPWRVGPYEAYHDLVIDRYTDESEEPDPSRYTPRHGRMKRITVEDVMSRVGRARREYGVGR